MTQDKCSKSSLASAEDSWRPRRSPSRTWKDHHSVTPRHCAGRTLIPFFNHREPAWPCGSLWHGVKCSAGLSAGPPLLKTASEERHSEEASQWSSNFYNKTLRKFLNLFSELISKLSADWAKHWAKTLTSLKFPFQKDGADTCRQQQHGG